MGIASQDNQIKEVADQQRRKSVAIFSIVFVVVLISMWLIFRISYKMQRMRDSSIPVIKFIAITIGIVFILAILAIIVINFYTKKQVEKDKQSQ